MADFKRAEEVLKDIVREVIESNDLVDTGRLRDTVEIIQFGSEWDISFGVETEDYWEFLDKEYNLFQQVESHPRFDKEFVPAIEKALSDEIDKMLEG